MAAISNINEYYQRIIASKLKGQREQAIDLYEDLTKKQQNEFYDWFEATYYYEAQDSDELNELYQFRQYFKTN